MATQKSRKGFGTLFAALALTTSALVAVGVAAPQKAQAAPQDIMGLTMATWNMQGASNNQDSKWTTGVRELTAGGRNDPGSVPRNVVALQEAGPEAPGTWLAAHTGANLTVTETQWELGTRTRQITRYVYFMETDPNGHRVNMAMVSDRRADEVVMVPAAPNIAASRATFGLRFGTNVIFTLHALSGGGGDAMPVLRNMATAAGTNDWLALGDFNRDPSSLIQAITRDANGGPRLAYVDSTGETTYQGTSELDYFVASPRLNGFHTPGRRPNTGGSDHWPVEVMPALTAQTTSYSISNTQTPTGTTGEPQFEASYTPGPDPNHYETYADANNDTDGNADWRTGNYDGSNHSVQLMNGDSQLGCVAVSGLSEPCDPKKLEQRFTVDVAEPDDSVDEPVDTHQVQIRPLNPLPDENTPPCLVFSVQKANGDFRSSFHSCGDNATSYWNVKRSALPLEQNDDADPRDKNADQPNSRAQTPATD